MAKAPLQRYFSFFRLHLCLSLSHSPALCRMFFIVHTITFIYSRVCTGLALWTFQCNAACVHFFYNFSGNDKLLCDALRTEQTIISKYLMLNSMSEREKEIQREHGGERATARDWVEYVHKWLSSRHRVKDLKVCLSLYIVVVNLLLTLCLLLKLFTINFRVLFYFSALDIYIRTFLNAEEIEFRFRRL